MVSGNTLTWVLGTVSPGDVTVSFSVQVDPATVGESVLKNVGHATSVSSLPVDAWTNTKVKGDVQVTMAVYNQAGELVRTFPSVYLSNPVDAMDLTGDGVLSDVGDSVTLTWEGGRVLGSWDGTGQMGQMVANGSYYVKVDSVDAYGVTSSVTKSVTVNRRVVKVTVQVYNEAGELVRQLYAEKPTGDSDVKDITLSTQVLHPGGDGKDGIPSTVGIVLSDGVAMTWDGTGENGTNVQDGTYYLQVKVENGASGTVEVTRPIAVLGSTPATGNTGVWPNVLADGQMVAILHARNLGSGQRIRAMIFTLAGMRAGVIEGLEGQNDLKWDLGRFQSGFYLVVLETAEGKLLKNRTILKVIVRK
jgi:flagellar hook assembly protein FlgD